MLSLSFVPIFEQSIEISATWEIEEFSGSIPTKEKLSFCSRINFCLMQC